jgi:hypothetical protein
VTLPSSRLNQKTLKERLNLAIEQQKKLSSNGGIRQRPPLEFTPYTSRIYDHYATKPTTPKPMFIRAIDTRKIEPIPTFMRPPWKEMDEDRIDLILKGSKSERFRREAAKIIQEKYERHVKIYTDGPRRTKERDMR